MRRSEVIAQDAGASKRGADTAHVTALACLAVFPIGLVAAVVWGSAAQIGLILLFGGAAALFLALRPPLLAPLEPLVVAVMIVNAAGWALGLLDRVPDYDEAVHFLTVMVVAACGSLLIWGPARLPRRSARFTLAVVVFGVAVGTVWEMLEWGFDYLDAPGGTMQIVDTFTDLLADTAGAVLAAPLAWLAIDRPPRGEAEIHHFPCQRG